MTSAQERVQVNRLSLDRWTTREQLCLASAVSCSGDQNWMSVSRTLKLVCGNTNRPVDWFSQKSCAVQYGHLLDNVETPKRKKRSSESNTGVASPATAETPTDLILRRIAEERVHELKADIRKEQEEYAKIYHELKNMESDQVEETQLLEMWRSIEKQQETQRIEEMKLENQMREREQKKQEMQRTWRSTLGHSATATAQTKLTTDTTTVDMDVEEIIGTGKPVISNVDNAPYNQQQQQAGTSPLLSSLLKSPTSSVAPTGVPGILSPVPGSVSASVTAPTITTLLTSGSIPNPNQPAITLKSNILPPNEAAELLARPISGPPTDSASITSTIAQNLLSPSQSAPTLSMLLEKNKTVPTSNNGHQGFTTANEVKANEVTASHKVDREHAMDFNNEEVPMDIEEDVSVAIVSSNMDLAAVDSDEPDPNEEQQLLEVFKNIGNIGELDIDVAAVIDDGGVDFLKDVDEEHINDSGDVMDFESKLQSETIPVRPHSADVKNDSKQKEGKEEIRSETKCSDEKAIREGTESIQVGATKVETISSDDSNDNIPLAAVAKERNQYDETVQEKGFLKEKVESAIKNEDFDASTSNETIAATINIALEGKMSEAIVNEIKINSTAKSAIAQTEHEKFAGDEQKSPADSENSDVIVIPTDDDDSNGEKQTVLGNKKSESVNSANQEIIVALKGVNGKLEPNRELEDQIEKETKSQMGDYSSFEEQSLAQQEISHGEYESNSLPPAIVSVDTDDSSTTDASMSTRKDDKMTIKLSSQQQQLRKNPHDTTRTGEQKYDEDSVTTISTLIAAAPAPARPPMLRKLRDRDRSESPLIDDEANTTSDYSTNQRSRRRYSSTPLLDSIPNSPASSDRDEREARASKKSLLSIYNAMHPNKNTVVLQRAFSDDHTPKYSEVCLRPMEWQAIKKNIESGAIRSVIELQRDIMLMSHNAMMVFRTNSADYKAAIAFLQECQCIREFTSSETVMKAEKYIKESKVGSATSSLNSSGVRMRMGSRKSQRIS